MRRWWVFGSLVLGCNFWQPGHSHFAKEGVAELPPRDLAVKNVSNSLLNSFNKILDDAHDSKDLSRFSDELAFAVLSVLHNMSSKFVRQKVADEVDSASRNELLANPDADGCFSRNYAQLCPVGWYELGDGKSCKATKEYKGSCDSTAYFPSTTPLSKQSFARQCDVSWPCRNACEEDYSMTCPDGWSDEAGLCKAPSTYRGNCVLQKHFFNFDEPSKARWAEECKAKWPCKHYDFDFSTNVCPVTWSLSADGETCEAPPSYDGPCEPVQHIGRMSNDEKARIGARCGLEWPADFQAHYDFSAPCPLGWDVSTPTLQDPECKAPEGYWGRCTKVQRLANLAQDKRYDFMLGCAATWPVKDMAERNYEAPCPSLWNLDSKESGICAAPATYNGPCQTRFSFKNYDAEMKKAFEGRCRAFFPNSAFSSLPKLQPLIVSTPLSRDSTGPIGPAASEYHGAVVIPNGTIYLPSRTSSSNPYLPQPPPKTPDSTASLATATANHIKRLQDIKKSAVNPKLGSLIGVAIEELKTQ